MNKIEAITVFIGALLVAGCSGEDREARLYGPDAYKIAGDSVPWDNERFDGSHRAWEQQMETRARLQNDYARIP